MKLVELESIDTTNYINPLHISHVSYNGDGSNVVMAYSVNNEPMTFYTDTPPREVRELIDEALRN